MPAEDDCLIREIDSVGPPACIDDGAYHGAAVVTMPMRPQVEALTTTVRVGGGPPQSAAVD